MRPRPADSDHDGWVRQLAVSYRRQEAKQHLRLAGPPAVPAIRRGLAHPDPRVRRACVSILDALLDDDAVPDLVAALDDADAQVVRRALHALACDQCTQGECRPADDLFVPRAIELLQHPDVDIRVGAIDALGKVAQRRADVAGALLAGTEGERDRGLRAMAVQAAGRAGRR